MAAPKAAALPLGDAPLLRTLKFGIILAWNRALVRGNRGGDRTAPFSSENGAVFASQVSTSGPGKDPMLINVQSSSVTATVARSTRFAALAGLPSALLSASPSPSVANRNNHVLRSPLSLSSLGRI